LAEALSREGGEAIARLTIPAIGVRKVVVEGVRVEDLRNGPGHYLATVLPGQPGNSGIAGHRTTYGAPFNRIDELLPGDEVNVRTVQGFHRYRVLPAAEAFAAAIDDPAIDFVIPDGEENLGHIIVRPDDTWVLGDFGDDRITLTACHPKLSAARRIIVAAELVSEPVDAPQPAAGRADGDPTLATEDLDTSDTDTSDATDADEGDGSASSSSDDRADESVSRDAFTPTDSPQGVVAGVSLDEGLDGDKSALLPAILWGLAAIAMYIGFKELGRRWRLWPSIALGVVPVVALMFFSFEHIDRYLPAG
jgi:sortase A